MGVNDDSTLMITGLVVGGLGGLAIFGLTIWAAVAVIRRR